MALITSIDLKILTLVWRVSLVIIYIVGVIGAITQIMPQYTPLQFEFWTWLAIGLMLLGCGANIHFSDLVEV